MPSILGELPRDAEKSAWLNFKDIYASSDADLFRIFMQANPHIEENTGAGAGAAVAVPAIPTLSGSAEMRKSCCIRIARADKLGQAYRLFKAFSREDPARVMLLPYWSGREGLVFVLVLKDRFPDKTAAAAAMEQLPVSLRKNATVIDGWDEDTVFYRGFGDES